MQDNTFVGLDVHKATISIAVAQGARGGEVRHWGTVPHRPDQVRKLVEKLAASGARLRFCYEAGPCGCGLHRQIVELGHDCIVVAPSLIPVKAGGGLARRALIEGAWSCRMQARISPKLLARQEALPQAVRDIAGKGQLRMCQRYRHLVAAGKAKVVVITAIAREMVSFIWAIARTAEPAKA